MQNPRCVALTLHVADTDAHLPATAFPPLDPASCWTELLQHCTEVAAVPVHVSTTVTPIPRRYPLKQFLLQKWS